VRKTGLARRAGVAEVVLTAHAGWDGERTRGSSALEDWPDVIATMTRDPDSDVRFLKAEGRDVSLDEDELQYDTRTRRVTLTGGGNRAQLRDHRHITELAEAVREIVVSEPGATTSAVGTALRDRDFHMQREDPGKACRLAAANGWVRREAGKRNAWLHYPLQPVSSESSRVVPESSPGTVVSIPDPSLARISAQLVRGTDRRAGRARFGSAVHGDRAGGVRRLGQASLVGCGGLAIG